MVKAEEIANMVRKQCGIPINADNDGKTRFFKEELLLILAMVHERKDSQEELHITDVVRKVLQEQSAKKELT